jgi:hypothetical protein
MYSEVDACAYSITTLSCVYSQCADCSSHLAVLDLYALPRRPLEYEFRPVTAITSSVDVCCFFQVWDVDRDASIHTYGLLPT